MVKTRSQTKNTIQAIKIRNQEKKIKLFRMFFPMYLIRYCKSDKRFNVLLKKDSYMIVYDSKHNKYFGTVLTGDGEGINYMLKNALLPIVAIEYFIEKRLNS